MIRGGRAERRLADSLKIIAKAGGHIADLGTPRRFHKILRPYEPLFEGVDYRAYGYEPEMKGDRYDCDGHQDIENLSFPDASLDAVICLDVLEHVLNPFKAAQEVVRVLRPGGYALVAVPFMAGYHGKTGSSQGDDDYPDHWRMTHTGLAHAFRDLSEKEVWVVAGPLELRLLMLRLNRLVALRPIRRLVDKLDNPQPGKATDNHFLFGRR